MRRRDHVVDVCVLALCVAALHARVLVGGETWAYGDHLSFTLPANAAFHDAVRAGHVPEWWDGIELGVSFAGNPNYGVGYPFMWLLALLPVGWGSDVLLLGHLLLGACGARALARRLGAERAGGLLAGVLFLASGYATSMIWNGRPLFTLAWTPWVACAADAIARAAGGAARPRAIAAFSLAAGAQILSGDPAGMVTASLVAGAVVLARAPAGWRARAIAVGWLGAGYALAAVVGAAVLVPGLLFVGTTERAGGLGGGAATAWSLHPLQLASMVWPQALGDAVQPAHDLTAVVADASAGLMAGPSWALDHHVGLVALVLAGAAVAWAPRGSGWRGLGVAWGVLVVIALGRYTPAYGLYRAVFLPERLVRFPEKHAAGALVLACALAGVGLGAALEPARRRAMTRALGAAAAVVLVGFGVLAATSGPVAARVARAGSTVDTRAALVAAIVGGAIALASVALAAAAVWRAPRLGAWAPRALAAVVAIVSLSQASHLVATIDRSYVASAPALLAPALVARAPGAARPRVHRPMRGVLVPVGITRLEGAVLDHETALPNLGASLGLADVPGSSGAYAAGMNALIGATPSAQARRFFALAGVEWVASPGGDALASGLPVAMKNDTGWTLERVPDARPRAFVAPRWQWRGGQGAAAAAAVASSDAGEVQLTGAGEAAPAGDAPLSPCALRVPRAERLELDCDAPAGGWAVVLDAWSPGWCAWVDGAPAPIVVADAAFKAVRVTPGRHAIVFAYRTPGLRAGALASLAGAIACAALLLVGRRRTSASPTS
jgi:hypothetical protein